jgi:ferric-dicitrate binding protein FerR (iron transport regulator)
MLQMKDDKIWEIIALCLAGEASGKQRQQLAAWRNENQNNELIFNELWQIWQQKNQKSPPFDSQKAFEKLNQKNQSK